MFRYYDRYKSTTNDRPYGPGFSDDKETIMKRTLLCTLLAVALLPYAVFAGEEAKKEEGTMKADSIKQEKKELKAEKKQEVEWMTTETGLKYSDSKVGDGPVAEDGDVVNVHYTGWLLVDGKRTKKFDSSIDRGKPIQFKLGTGRVIKGWDQGIKGMHVGGKRELIIPPDLGYGSRGAGGVIPPNATLDFEVELVSIEGK